MTWLLFYPSRPLLSRRFSLPGELELSILAVESVLSSFAAVFAIGSLVVVVLFTAESVPSSFSAVFVACCCIAVESLSSSFSAVVVI